MSRKRRQKEQLSSDRGEETRIASGADNQLFWGKKKNHMCFGSAFASYHISCLLKGKMIYVRLSEAN